MKIEMNEMSLMNYISHYLHTCICRYDSTYNMVSSCCARRDLPISLLQPAEMIKPLITESSTYLPRIVSAEENLIYGVVPFQHDFYVIGPNLLQDTIHLNHRLYRLPDTEASHTLLYECGLSDYVRILLLLYHLEAEKPEGETDIIHENCLENTITETIQKTYTETTFERNETEQPHNPYDQEFREQSSIENGNIAEFQYAAMVHELKEQQKGTPVKEKNPHIRRCKNYIYSHLHDKLTVQSLAGALNINANYLSELFQKCEGISLSRYILREKIERAKNLLTYSEYSYIEIAAYLGFSSQSHLGAQFKKITGCTLRQYRSIYGVNQ